MAGLVVQFHLHQDSLESMEREGWLLCNKNSLYVTSMCPLREGKTGRQRPVGAPLLFGCPRNLFHGAAAGREGLVGRDWRPGLLSGSQAGEILSSSPAEVLVPHLCRLGIIITS